MTSYIPARDTNLQAWAANFSTKITANPPLYGLTSADAAAIAAPVAAYTAALSIVTTPATKTKTTVADKDAARASMLALVRPYAQLVRNNAGVSNEDKLALGLTIPDTSPTPIPAPTTQPVISVPVLTPGTAVLRYADTTSPTSRAKPAGVIGMQLFGSQDATPPVDPADWNFLGIVTTQPYEIDTSGMDPTKVLNLTARWQTRRGLVGPFAASVQIRIAVGS